MTKKSVNKIVSAILVMALMLTTVFSCLITVSAADATGSYTIVGDVVPSGARTATAEVTFTSDTAFTAGSFDLMFDEALLDKDLNGDGNRDYVNDTDGDGKIKNIDANGDGDYNDADDSLETEAAGTLLPNVYEVYYADTDGDGNQEALANIYDTKIEIIGGTKADGTVVDGDTDFVDSTITGTTADYIEPSKEDGYTTDYSSKKFFSTVDVVSPSLSYQIATVSDDSDNIVNQDTQYAEGFKNVKFATTNDAEYKSITFKVTFDFTGRSDRRTSVNRNYDNGHLDASGKPDGRSSEDNFMLFGTNYKFDVTTSSFTTNTVSTVGFTGEAGNVHTHRYIVSLKSENLISDGDGFNVYMGKCNYCDHTAPQMVPDGTTGDNYSNFYPHNYKGIYGTNIVYENDGTLSLNLHFPEYVSGDTLFIAYENGDATKYNLATYSTANGTVSSSFYADADGKGILVRNAKMLKLTGLSAKDVDTTLYIARYNTSNGLIGTTYEFSIADYCMSVINGDKVYYVEGTPSEEIVADQAVAAALINYGYAAKDAMNAETPAKGTPVSWNTGAISADQPAEGSGTPTDPYIIKTAEELAGIATGKVDTADKYYKVADGITAFYMNGGEKVAAMTSVTEVKTYFEANPGRDWWQGDNYFKGTFDGNGATVYGLYANKEDAGLFFRIGGNATIKNIAVKNSYFAASGTGNTNGNAGAIAGCVEYYSGIGNATVTIENCVSANNYIAHNAANSSSSAGAIIGHAREDKIVVNNCLAYGNEFTGEAYLVGNGWNAANSISNTVVIDGLVYGSNNSLKKSAVFTNVYTNVDQSASGIEYTEEQVKQLEKSQMQGNAARQNMTALDWENSWAYGYIGEYPSIAKPNNTGVESTSSFGGYDDDFITEDGVGSGTKNDPYIISTANQLASVCANRITNVAGGQKGSIDTTDVYFKVADGITAFYMNGGETVANLTSAKAVKDYFEEKGGSTWWSYGTFNGHFDGNGATVYGIYSPKNQQNNGGLFHCVGTSAVIENINVKNCYFATTEGSSDDRAVGGIVAYTSIAAGTLTINNCSVINCYLASQDTDTGYHGSVGTIVGDAFWGPTITISNCLVAGNIAENAVASTPGLIGFTGSTPTIKNTVSIGTSPYTVNTNKPGDFYKFNKAEAYTDVYTDQDLTAGESAYSNYPTNYDGHITKLTTAQMQGIYAKNSMPALDWNDAKTNPDGVWYQGAIGEYPSFKKADNLLPTELKSYYDQLVSEHVYDTYGVSNTEFGMFGTSLNLKVNPYISFTLAFNKQYKTDRANINVTFSAGNSSVTVNGDNMVNNVANGAGRYHMYRFKTITVEDLSQPITVSASYGGTTYDFGKFTVGGFALDVENYYNMVPCDYYKYCANAANALMFYVEAVNYRYGNIE